MLTVAEALDAMLAACAPAASTSNTPLCESLGRVLSEPVTATVDVPPWDNSAMDGYAVACADLADTLSLPLGGTFAAGCEPGELQPGSAARIFTGAPVPLGADAVIMQEEAEVHDGTVVFSRQPVNGQNIRRKGEDIATGDVLLEKGHRLRAADVGLLASVGAGTVKVFAPLKVAVLSTGEELAEPGEKLEGGQIYNSNRFTLQALLQVDGFEVIDGGKVGDNREDTVKRLQELGEQADVLISTGGVSVGEEDHVKAAMETVGELELWKVAIKPGKPFAFGRVSLADRQPRFFGLPGNPVSAFVTYQILIKPVLQQMQGVENYSQEVSKFKAGFDWPAKTGKKPGSREEYLRARISVDGELLEIHPEQGSGVLSSVTWCDGLAVVPANTRINKGDDIDFIPVHARNGG